MNISSNIASQELTQLKHNKVYIAAPWRYGAKAQGLSEQLATKGFDVQCDWIKKWEREERVLTPVEAERLMQINLTQAKNADHFVLFASPTSLRNRGGRLCEFGVAVLKHLTGMEKQFYLIGKEQSETLQHCVIPEQNRFEDEEALVRQVRAANDAQMRSA